MIENVLSILAPVVALVLLLFVGVRLRFLSRDDIGGRAAFIAGALLVLASAAWSAVTALPDYSAWFIDQAYPAIDVARFAVLTLGLVLIAVAMALYADLWQTRGDDIELREGKLGILENLQQDARRPYQIMPLLDIALKDVLVHLPGCAGAVFLINRARRQFVLTVSAGFSREETAGLEYFPLERNPVTQAVDIGDPVVGGRFLMYRPDAPPVQTRFESSLILPLVSGMEKIGGIILVSEETHRFARADVRYLMPVADWLAEKIRSHRLSRELSLIREESEQRVKALQEASDRFDGAAATIGSAEPVTAFCRSLVGLVDSESVHLYGLVEGRLHLFGGSDALGNLSEGYRTALIDSLDRGKPLVINQETGGDQASRVVTSSFIYPIAGTHGRCALLFRRGGSPFSISRQELGLLSPFSHLGRLVLMVVEGQRRDVTRRVGFDRITQLLRTDDHDALANPAPAFLRLFKDLLRPEDFGVAFRQEGKGRFRAVDGVHIQTESLAALAFSSDEAMSPANGLTEEPRFIFGHDNVQAEVALYPKALQSELRKLSEHHGPPHLLALCPVGPATNGGGLVLFAFLDVGEDERLEYQRLLTLACGLVNLRGAIQEAKSRAGSARDDAAIAAPAQLINALNNSFAGVIGSADLLRRQSELSDETRSRLDDIITETEQAARLVRGSLQAGDQGDGVHPANEASHPGTRLGDVLRRTLDARRISGDLYLAGTRATEIDCRFDEGAALAFTDEQVARLFDAVLESFAVQIEQDDMITVATYRRDDFVYLDLSRHRKNFPPVESVSSFGRYRDAADELRQHPDRGFLAGATELSAEIAAEENTDRPAFLSFKFPLETATPGTAEPGSGIQILAIDDEAVILDLIAAMCQSLGYRVVTASSGEEGLRLSEQHRFDIVLTDLAMPGLSGIEVARRLRERHPSLPIVLVTGWESSLDSDHMRQAGITEVLYKPFRIEQLTDLLQSAALKRA